MKQLTRSWFIATSLAVVIVSLAGCGDDGNTPPDPDDVPGTGGDLTIEIHRNFPFVAGDTADDARFVAVQDGDGAFTAVSGVNGVYNVHVDSDRYGIAVACVDTGFATIEVVQRVVPADGTLYRTACKSLPSTARLDVAVSNLPANHRLRLRAGIAGFGTASTDTTVSLNVRPGTTELFGTLTNNATQAVVKVFRIPAIDVATVKTIALDLATQGTAPENRPLTLTLEDPTAVVRTAVVRPSGTITLPTSVAPVAQPPTSYLMLPAALQQADDLYRVTVTGASGSQSRTAKNPTTLAFALPNQFVAPQATLVRAPFLRPVFTFSPTPSVLPIQSYLLDAATSDQLDFTSFHDWFATLSPAWIAGVLTIRYEFPDLSAIPGFADVALVDRERIDARITRNETTADVAVDGTVSTSSTSANAALGEFCGDGIKQAGEVCDPGAEETATCDLDCTPVVCGDDVTNVAAGEDCDPPEADICSETCKALP